MNKFVAAAFAAVVCAAGPAGAADIIAKARPAPPPPPPSMFDINFGGVVQSDYNFRGISQSNRGPSGGAYFEPELTLPYGKLYVGLAAWSISWPSDPAFGFSNPAAEVNFTGGWRHAWGPVSVDFGFIYYFYPKEQNNVNSDFWEIYGKLEVEVTNGLTIGGAVFWTPDMLGYGRAFSAAGVAAKAAATYGAVNAKWVLPWKVGDLGSYISGELGHWWIDDAGFVNPVFGFRDPSYTYGNIGFALTYKALTLDLRYHATNMDDAHCGAFLLVGVPNPSNRWCGNTFIAALKFDTSLSALK